MAATTFPAPAAESVSAESRPAVFRAGWHRDAFTTVTVGITGIFGLAWALLMPPFQFNDEHAHFARSYQISQGEFIGRADSQLPSGILATLAKYPERLPYKSAVRPSAADLVSGGSEASTPPQSAAKFQGLNFFGHGIASAQVYWSGCYIPASIGIALARLLSLSPVAMLYGARILNLLAFLTAFAAALLLAPGFRSLLTGVALMPMTIQQAVAVSADSITISFAFLGFALLLRARETRLSQRYLVALFIVVPLWVLSKNSLWAVLLLLLIPAGQFPGRAQRVACLAAMTAISGLALLGWRAMTSGAFDYYAAAELSKGLDLSGNVRLLAAHPFQILHDLILLPDPLFNFARMTSRFVGTFGWEFHPLPLAFLYLPFLLAVACFEFSPKPFTMAQRGIFLLVFAFALVQTYAMLFVIDGTMRNSHYAFRFAGVQGRYLIPFCLAGFLALRQRRFTVPDRVLGPAVLVVATCYSAFCLRAMADYFYA